MKLLSVLFLVVLAYSLGMWHGWAVGVHDAPNLVTVQP